MKSTRLVIRLVTKAIIQFTLSLCTVMVLTSAIAQSASAKEGLWNVLKEGGKVVLMRHAPVERTPASGNPLLRDPSCINESNLSNQGKRNADLVGRNFRDQNIPVAKVMHSPYCRTSETARIAFGTATPAEYLSLLEVLSSEEASLQTDELSHIIGSYAGNGNLVLVTHEPNISAVSFELLKHLDFLVVDPKGGEEFEELGVIRSPYTN